MASTATSIEWTDATWNPTVGCDRISPGCAKCYAKELHDRRHKAFLAGKAMAPQYAKPFEALQLMADRLDAPLHWRKPRQIFVNSVSDLFHEDVPDAFIDGVFAVMALAPQHTFQILTKRAQRMRDYASSLSPTRLEEAAYGLPKLTWNDLRNYSYPFRNVWLGVSVENQHFADERIPLLLQTPAAVRFISAEPLLESIDIWTPCSRSCPQCRGAKEVQHSDEGGIWGPCPCERLAGLSWVIVGGESGPGARPFDLAWGRSIIQQCQAAGVPVFVKQLGANVASSEVASSELAPFISRAKPLKDRKGGDPSEWPEDLRIRQFPEAAR